MSPLGKDGLGHEIKGHIRQDLLTEAKQRLPLSALMAQLGFGDSAKKSARCPFHEDDSNSFSFYRSDDGEENWKCHAGCGQGDAVDFLAKHRGLSNSDACREFNRLAGITQTPEALRVESRGPMKPTSPTPTHPPFDWQPYVVALTPEHRLKLAAWRGYSPEFIEWAHTQEFIGLFDGERIAFAVTQGNTTGCHYRLKEDGSWRYHPTGTRVAPFIIGNIATATTVFVFESPWDLLAVLDCLRHHIQPLVNTAAIATRGASNGRLLAGLCASDATVYAFKQNDRAGQTWLGVVAANCGCKCVHVGTPSPHKDVNDWTRAGATRPEIEAAIAAAEPIIVSNSPDLHATSSGAVIELPNELDDEPEAAPFPVDRLPSALAEIIAAVAQTEHVPTALPAVCALGVVSAAIGAGLEIASRQDRVTRGNIYVLASAPSGSGKSESFRPIMAPLIDYQARLIETWKTETSPQLQAQIRVLDKEIGLLEKKAAKTTEAVERERMIGELKFKLALKDDLARRAVMPCIIAQDVTTERLAGLLRDNGELLFSASADARKVIENVLGRYKPGNTTDESFYLAASGGDYVRVDRQGREPITLNRPCLALCWLIQPDMMTMMVNEESLSVSGFLPRLLVCHTHAVPHLIEGETQGLSSFVRERWTKLIDGLLVRFHTATKPQCITPTPEAKSLVNEFHNNIVGRMADDLADVSAFAYRYAEQVWRISVVLHAAQWAETAGSEPLAIETAAAAICVVEWFIASQLDILAKGRRAIATKLNDEVFELLKTNRQRRAQDFTTARDVHRARITPTAEAAKSLLMRMESEGELVSTEITPTHGGKSTRIYRAVQNPVPE